MIYYRVIDQETEDNMQRANFVVKNLFYNICRIINCGGGFPIIIEANEFNYQFIIKLTQNGQPIFTNFPYSRVKRAVAAANATMIISQDYWPVTIVHDVIEGKARTIISIKVNEEAAATFLRRCGNLLPLLHIELPKARCGELFPGSYMPRPELPPSVPVCHAPPKEESLSPHDDETDDEEMLELESEMEPYPEVEDLT